ncbi:hypothetical protein CGCSCA1_v000238 [Colletotrichum siamense]|nr:hypothetical protein CGCSCA1_v000238 [Colletotrichum siamense]
MSNKRVYGSLFYTTDEKKAALSLLSNIVLCSLMLIWNWKKADLCCMNAVAILSLLKCKLCLNKVHMLMQEMMKDNGADIHSRDYAGLPIWVTAKKNNKQGSYARDMWDFILAYCGFHSEVEAFARDTPRHAVYRQGWYSRADFEEIWKGMEHLCPCYGDEASGLDCASFISETPSSSRRPSISDSWASTTSSIDGRDIDQMTPDQQQDLSEDESVKTWLSKSSVSSDMSDSPSVASLQYLGNTEVGFSEEVYENPWAEG